MEPSSGWENDGGGLKVFYSVSCQLKPLPIPRLCPQIVFVYFFIVFFGGGGDICFCTCVLIGNCEIHI